MTIHSIFPKDTEATLSAAKVLLPGTETLAIPVASGRLFLQNFHTSDRVLTNKENFLEAGDTDGDSKTGVGKFLFLAKNKAVLTQAT
ncbi:Parvalbumin beta [Tupaia chinensis]|uniref:Parvalbumin beta n=1 Tax=Tupaia chinensis TaxID=246437 RepID=L9KQB6_TUPCH|nr:Parvalbumin beta [Tupaia chinensis]